jgi:DNA repair exonuclease SbcCD ATPase subunit
LNNKTGEHNSTFIKQLEEEMKAKDELIEEANQFIEEFNNEKHELKAKFKHLMQVLDDPSLAPEDESSYKEEDDIDLNACFDVLETHLLTSKKRLD